MLETLLARILRDLMSDNQVHALPVFVYLPLCSVILDTVEGARDL